MARPLSRAGATPVARRSEPTLSNRVAERLSRRLHFIEELSLLFRRDARILARGAHSLSGQTHVLCGRAERGRHLPGLLGGRAHLAAQLAHGLGDNAQRLRVAAPLLGVDARSLGDLPVSLCTRAPAVGRAA